MKTTELITTKYYPILSLLLKKVMKWHILSQNFHKHDNKEKTELRTFCVHQLSST